MDFPKKMMRFCRFCVKQTEHTIKKSSKGKKRKLSEGERRFRRKFKGYGSFPKPNPRGLGKPTKKLDLRAECSECKKMSTFKKGFRVKKFELK